MDQNLQVAQELLQSILEQHLFLFADPVEDVVRPSGEIAYLKIKMGFSGDLNGRFVMLFPEEISKEVIANLLGLEPDAPEFLTMTASDAAAEIMNIVGGNIVSRLLNEQGHYDLQIPNAEKFDALEWEAFLEENHLISLSIDGKNIYFQVIVN
ncbi:MAG: hypothetical protein A2X86_00705 [Bdellovibrionales bacterium GWA2_49_15]|nr:MAG: hypothetical protein A2X86_00705 [Bdellovibrionales bacterium GWA2_49_15]